MLNETLRSLAEKRGFDVGAAVAPGPILDNALYAQTLAREYSMLTAENVMKPVRIHPEPDRYDFGGADILADFAAKHGMKVHAHTLVWHNQNPTWLTEREYSRAELLDIMERHIHEVAGHLRGRVAIWDVVNEAIEDYNDSRLRETVWSKGIGPNYLDHAFRLAHKADPDAKLFYNDYANEGMNPKSNYQYEMVRSMLESGVPIHGVGLQMHIRLNNYPSLQELEANMTRLGELGLEVQITEFDVQTWATVGTAEQKREIFTTLYRDMFRLCLDHPACTAFITWGFTDRHSWIHSHFHPDEPLPFDDEYQPKPAYHAMMDVLRG
jgi:endo-1,4-beta-xylanase